MISLFVILSSEYFKKRWEFGVPPPPPPLSLPSLPIFLAGQVTRHRLVAGSQRRHRGVLVWPGAAGASEGRSMVCVTALVLQSHRRLSEAPRLRYFTM